MIEKKFSVQRKNKNNWIQSFLVRVHQVFLLFVCTSYFPYWKWLRRCVQHYCCNKCYDTVSDRHTEYALPGSGLMDHSVTEVEIQEGIIFFCWMKKIWDLTSQHCSHQVSRFTNKANNLNFFIVTLTLHQLIPWLKHVGYSNVVWSLSLLCFFFLWCSSAKTSSSNFCALFQRCAVFSTITFHKLTNHIHPSFHLPFLCLLKKPSGRQA